MSARLQLGDVLFDARGISHYVVTSVDADGDVTLVRIPLGMMSTDLGRHFKHQPTDDDPHAFALIDPSLAPRPMFSGK